MDITMIEKRSRVFLSSKQAIEEFALSMADAANDIIIQLQDYDLHNDGRNGLAPIMYPDLSHFVRSMTMAVWLRDLADQVSNQVIEKLVIAKDQPGYWITCRNRQVLDAYLIGPFDHPLTAVDGLQQIVALRYGSGAHDHWIQEAETLPEVGTIWLPSRFIPEKGVDSWPPVFIVTYRDGVVEAAELTQTLGGS